MSIIKSINRAYQIKEERNWDTIYWAIDLHSTCIKSNYVSGEYEWINEDAKQCLQLIRSLKETRLIMWTSSFLEAQEEALEFFNNHNIYFDYGNQNPEVWNTKTGCFDKKFYFSVGIDDKFGFDPDTDWKLIYEWLKSKYE